jgi:WD40 repeat protein
MRVWQAHDQPVVTVAFAPAGDHLATAADDEPGVRLWDVAETAVRRELAVFKETATCLAFSPDGSLLAVGRPWSVELWDPATSAQRLILEGHRHFCGSLAFAADGRTLLSTGERRGGRWHGSIQAVIWDLADYRVLAEFVSPPSDRLGLTRALDASTVLWVQAGQSEKADPVVTVTDVPANKPRVLFHAPGPVRDAALAIDGRTLATAVRGDVVLWSLGDVPPQVAPPSGWRRWFARPTVAAAPPLTPKLALPAGAERIDALAFTPDGRQLVAGSAIGTVRLWDVPDLPQPTGDVPAARRPRAVYDFGIGPVTAVAVSADGLTAAAGGATGRVVVWDVEA